MSRRFAQRPRRRRMTAWGNEAPSHYTGCVHHGRRHRDLGERAGLDQRRPRRTRRRCGRVPDMRQHGRHPLRRPAHSGALQRQTGRAGKRLVHLQLPEAAQAGGEPDEQGAVRRRWRYARVGIKKTLRKESMAPPTISVSNSLIN